MADKTKLIFCIDSPGFGGSEINAIKLIGALKEYYTIDLVIPANSCSEIKEYAKENQLKTILFQVSNRVFSFIGGLKKLYILTNRSKTDLYIVWAHHLDSNRWLQLMLAMRRRRFVIVEQLLPTDYSVLKKSRLTIPVKKYVTSRALKTIICAYSQVANYANLFKCKNIAVIPNTRPVLKISEEIQFLRSHQKNKNGKIILCCIGRLTNQKDQQSLIKALALLPSNKNVQLILAGDGENLDELTALSSELGLTNVEVTGFLQNVFPVLAISDIFILPSILEGLPGALLEAIAAGVSCIATDIPGNRELIIDNETGLLVPIHSPQKISAALQYLIEHPDERKRMSLNAYKLVLENYDETIEINKWLNLLEKSV